MDFETITYEKQGRKALVTLNRPERLNALSPQMSEELHVVWQDFNSDPELWVGILTGTGDRAFSAGADLKIHAENRRAGLTVPVPDTPPGGLCRDVEIWKPIIAAINGYAVGAGLEIALACDIRIAADHAQMGLPEVRWSLIPAAGGMSRLYRSVPRAIAMRMLLTGERIDARQALQWGLVSDVVPLPDLLPLAHRIADTILDNAPLAVRAVKEVAIRGSDMALPDSLRLELEAYEPLRQTEDYKEGPVAFAEKRKANFQGR